MLRSNRGLFASAASIAFVASAVPAYAQAGAPEEGAEEQAADTGGLDVIIVTAQKRSQALQDVPVSVQVLGGDQLRARSETQIDALVKVDPSLKFDEGTNDVSSGLRVRGVGTQSYASGVEQSVAVVRDGVVAANSSAALLNFNDVERIEVLRGPQGILFGKNASAGLVNIITRGPGDTLEVGGGITYGSNDLLLMDGYVSGPVTDSVGVRIAGFRNTMDPLIDNAYAPGPSGVNDRHDWGVRGKIRWEPSNVFDAMLTYEHMERDANCCGNVGIEYVPGGAGRAELAGAPVGSKNDLAFAPDTTLNYTNYDSASLEMNLETGAGVVTSVTGWQNSANQQDFRAFNTGSFIFFVRNFGTNNTKQFTQELRFTTPEGAPIEFVGGLYYYHSNSFLTLDQRIDIGVLFGNPPLFLGLQTYREIDSSNTSYAGFGNLTWNVSDDFRLSAGARLQRDTADIYSNLVNPDDGTFVVPITPNAGDRFAKRSDTGFSWRLAAEYDVAPDALIYASAVRGYKSLGINTLGTVLTAIKPIIDPEIPTSYELGWKTELLDRKLRINGSLFHTTFKDFQAQSIVTDPNTNITSFDLATAGELVTKGAELQIDARPVPNLTLSGAVTYVKSKYTDFTGAPCYDGQTAAQGCVGSVQDLTDAPLPGVSKWNFNASARYEVPVDSLGIDVYTMASYYYRSDFNLSTDPTLATNGYGVADLFIGFDTQDGRFGMQVYAKNLFDDFYTTGLTTFDRNLSGYNRSQNLAYDYKRRLGISAHFRF